MMEEPTVSEEGPEEHLGRTEEGQDRLTPVEGQCGGRKVLSDVPCSMISSVGVRQQANVEDRQGEVASLRTEVLELRGREKTLRAQAESQQRHAGLQAAALRAESEYVREQATVAREQIRSLRAELTSAHEQIRSLRAGLAEAQRRIARSPYFTARRLLGRLLRRR